MGASGGAGGEDLGFDAGCGLVFLGEGRGDVLGVGRLAKGDGGATEAAAGHAGADHASVAADFRLASE